MSAGKKKQKLKQAETPLMHNLAATMPMVEEITKDNLVPLCLIGFSVDVKAKLVTSKFSTLADDHDKVAYEVCKQLVESHKHLYE